MGRAISRYSFAIAVLAAAILLRWLLDPWMADTLPLVTLFGAVAAAVWVGGFLPAVVVLVLGYFACSYLFIPPRGVFLPHGFGQVVGMLAYLFTCSLIIGFGEALRVARARARERREVLGVTLRSIGDAVMSTDVEGRVTYMNTVAESLTGWTLAEAVGQPLDTIFRIVNEATRTPVESPATRALREGVVVGLANHTVLIRKDGSVRAIDDSAAPIQDDEGRVSGCVLIFRDVSEQRRIEHDKAGQLAAARLLAAVVESSDDAIISKSLDGVIQTWNAAAERLFGYAADEAIGKHISLVIPPERLGEEDQIVASLKAGRRVDHFETERLRKDGRRILVSLTISPIKNDEGTVIGASKIVRDVTQQRQAEERERQLLADAATINARYTAELSEAARRKDEFLAMLAHELRNPLAPMSNVVQVLRARGRDGEAVQQATAMLDRQVGQMTRLVDDLLDMSRISRGKIELRKERVELAPIVHQAVEATRAIYAGIQQELTVSLPPEPIVLDADPARLAQVVSNLLNNACKFTDRGGRIRLTVAPEGDAAVIRVQDTGIGIAPESLPTVFQMFTQIDTSLERSRDGLGIGLTLVKSLVEQHGGTVEARSDGLGHGSEFTVRLPALRGAPRSVARPALDEPAPVIGRRVLVVDDNADGAASLSMLLELEGHATRVAHDGVEAVEMAMEFRPEVVLLDIGLPEMNGYEVCRSIRKQPWGEDLTMVAVTGWGTHEDRERSREAGFDAHIVKPIDPDALMQLMESLPSSGRAR